MSDHEPPHDGMDVPPVEVELPADGEVVVLSRHVEMTTRDGRVKVTLPPGAPVTSHGPLVPGGNEIEITAALPVAGTCTVTDLRTTAEMPDPDGEEEGR